MHDGNSPESIEKLRKQLLETRSLLDEVQRVARLGYWTLNLESWQFEWSEGAFQIWGRDPGLGSPTYREYVDTLPREDRRVVERAGERAVSSGATFEVEHRIMRADDTRWVKLQGEVLEDENRMVGVVQDVTDQRRLEAQLRQAQKMEAVGRLAGGIAHDFNNLLTVILSFTDLARERLTYDHPADEDLREVLAAAERAEKLTAQLLAFSRRKAVHPEILNANEVVANARVLLAHAVGERIRYEEKLTAEPLAIEIDKDALEQVLLNLVVNARDAMPDGGRVEVRCESVDVDAHWNPVASDFIQPGVYVAISVRDNGMGVTPHVEQRMFEPFFTTKGSGGGTGLGLATCLGIVQQANGFITVEPGEVDGTIVTVLLPRREHERQDPDEYRRSARLSGTETILVAEDNDQVRALTLSVLERYGYQPVGAASGPEALEILESSSAQFDLLLTDVVMPQMNGRELADRVIEQRPGIRVLFMSGFTGDAINDRGVLETGVHLLQKPFTPERLLTAVRTTLDNGPGTVH